MNDLLSLNEYAAFLKQSRSNLYTLIDKGLVPPTFNIGGRRFVRKSTVEARLIAQEQQAIAA